MINFVIENKRASSCILVLRYKSNVKLYVIENIMLQGKRFSAAFRLENVFLHFSNAWKNSRKLPRVNDVIIWREKESRPKNAL